MRIFFAVADAVTAALVLVAALLGLPTRWWPVDATAVGVAAALVAAAALSATGKAPAVLRALCGLVLGVGLLFVASLALSASHLAGIYGPIGQGGALLLLLVAALLVPYLVALPAAQLVWARERR